VSEGVSPISVVERWFAAHAAGDLDAARALFADDAIVVTPDAELHGFDAFMEWYQRRRELEGPGFSYPVVDLLGGATHAAAIIGLTGARGTRWRQVAVYKVEKGRIAAMTAYEDPK
jgi:hypothetical protein